ncbi:hypothetical protein ACFQ0M_38775 [Kitasatospora aburaviensis]
MGKRGDGLLAQLRRPPGGRDGRIMLLAQFLDRAGTGCGRRPRCSTSPS